MKAMLTNTAASRLCKKLSALRATLPNDEREMLDNLVLVNEVAASAKPSGKVVTQRSTKAARLQIHFDAAREAYQLIKQ